MRDVVRHIVLGMPFYVPIAGGVMIGLYGYIGYKVLLKVLDFLTSKKFYV
jgi:hypothetical protein